jgi:hypothetical protein
MPAQSPISSGSVCAGCGSLKLISYPDFHAGYLAARVAVDRHGRKGGSQPAPAPQAAPKK